MDQAAIDGFVRHYQQLPAEDLAALDQRRSDLTPEAIAALDQVLKDTAKQAAVAAVADDIRRVIAPKPLGLGGWLRFLIFGFIIYGPAQIGLTLYSFAELDAKTPGLAAVAVWQEFELATWLVIGLQTIVCLYLAFQLCYCRNRRTICRVIAALWLFEPLGVCLLLGLTKLTLGADGVAAIMPEQDWAADIMNSLLVAAIWILYLLMSKRVRALYPTSPVPAS